jgi:SAM-dependent methyltransferase
VKLFSKDSSNFLVINGDNQKVLILKILYLLFNFIHNSFSRLRLRQYPIRRINFSNEQLKEIITSNIKISPARLLSEAFWINLKYDKISIFLKHKIRIMDLGCGAGKLSELTNKFDTEVKYTGIDSQAYFSRKISTNITFEKADYLEILDYMPFSLIVSQSALEHFELDLKLFKLITNYTQNGQPLIQIHLVPSFNCLSLYLMHGFRQYGSCSLNRIFQLHSKGSQFLIVALGGKKAKRFHFWHITIPLILSRIFTKFNLKENSYSIHPENVQDDQDSPGTEIFYAIIITHNIKQDINELI